MAAVELDIKMKIFINPSVEEIKDSQLDLGRFKDEGRI